MSVLKHLTEQLNALDEVQDGFICTIEREDLCEAIDQLAAAAGIRGKGALADQWREW